jgi:hypothetical protein
MYTPPGSAWDKQLTPEYVGEARQRIIEVFSGHGNSEEYRRFREVVLKDDGTRECPQPTRDFLPGCWQAGEIIRARCLADGDDEEDCEEAAVEARQNFVKADRNGGGATVPGGTVEEWKDAGQCRDCFQPAFNYRPKSSVQYILALAKQQGGSEPLRFEMGFIASSDNHSARPGTGYKEIARSEFTEARFGTFVNTPLALGIEKEPSPESVEFDATTSNPPFAFWETERAGSFFLNGGLAAVHANGRDRQSIWEALERKEVYGTSGPRMLLWFDLLNGPGSLGQTVPMGGSAQLGEAPIFQVRAVGSFEQKPGCPEHATTGLDADRLARLCRNECYYPSDRRRVITRIEVVRIRPQLQSGEAVDGLIEDPWRSFACQPDPAGCSVTFTDADFGSGARSALYYVRAIESPSLAVGANPLGCEYDAQGSCVKMDPCGARPNSDDCLAQTEERAWSSPIWVDYVAGAGPIAAAAPPPPR